jgi:hypothetical protein
MKREREREKKKMSLFERGREEEGERVVDFSHKGHSLFMMETEEEEVVLDCMKKIKLSFLEDRKEKERREDEEREGKGMEEEKVGEKFEGKK